MATTKTTRGLDVRCPMCGVEGAFLGLNLNALDVIQCNECSEEFTPEQARRKAVEQVAAWDRVIRMIEAAGE